MIDFVKVAVAINDLGNALKAKNSNISVKTSLRVSTAKTAASLAWRLSRSGHVLNTGSRARELSTDSAFDRTLAVSIVKGRDQKSYKQ
eukprot:2751859-Heterocapsa_arctica.AAC.1